MDEGRRNYAFYLCNSCQEPYFGGTAECADQEEGELPAEDRLCPTCQPQPNILCQDPVQHLGFHVWKCRYCCNPSEYICYGTVHFCQPCHARNSRRVREGRGRGSGPPPLEAIACTGRCPFPKPTGQTLHANGSTPSCEQVYHCAWCLSSPSQQPYAFIQESGSRNFIVNASGEQGFHGWAHSRQNGYQRWRVEISDIPVNASISTNFVSSYQWCVMMQEVPLHTFVRDPSTARIEVSTKIMGRTDCPSVFQMKAVVRDSRDRVLNRVQTDSITTPADYWEKVSLIVEPVAGAHSIIMVVCGKDARYWGGYFGSKVTDCSVRILCPENELQNVLLPAGAVAERARVMPIPRIDAEQLRARFFDIWAPVLLILLVWLSSYS